MNTDELMQSELIKIAVSQLGGSQARLATRIMLSLTLCPCIATSQQEKPVAIAIEVDATQDTTVSILKRAWLDIGARSASWAGGGTAYVINFTSKSSSGRSSASRFMDCGKELPSRSSPFEGEYVSLHLDGSVIPAGTRSTIEVTASADYPLRTLDGRSHTIPCRVHSDTLRSVLELAVRAELDSSRAESARLRADSIAEEQRARTRRDSLVAEARKLRTNDRLIQMALKGDIAIGMPRSLVLLAWGDPSDVHTTVSAFGKEEQFVYGSGRYVYISKGVVRSAQY